jgi:hypothetical protein
VKLRLLDGGMSIVVFRRWIDEAELGMAILVVRSGPSTCDGINNLD